MFEKILIANRGEIAVRIIKTCRRLGIGTVATYSEADFRSSFVKEADEAAFIGPPPATDSYLDMGKIIGVALEHGCQAVHPGYGFLSENPGFARIAAEAGLVFIGPPVNAIALLGDKIASKELAIKVGAPVVPGCNRPLSGADEALIAAERIGFPVLLKPASGGGGRGMRIVRHRNDLPSALAECRDETRKGFADDRIFIERYIPRARHVEIQIVADHHGNVIHMGERECSIQRRHQKIIEETPSTAVDESLREKMGDVACSLAREAGYVNAGTVEFILDEEKSFYFLEMNTRLQVEHTVTEMVTGLDLVELQLRVADGEPLPVTQGEVNVKGWAIEARICAEDPYRDFLPTTGMVTRYAVPLGENIRLDSGIDAGSLVTIYYDSLLAKVIAFGQDREEARQSLVDALNGYHIEGIKTNVDFANAIINQPAFVAGDLSTNFIQDHFDDGESRIPPAREKIEHMVIAAVLVHHTRQFLVRDSLKPMSALVGVYAALPVRHKYIVKVDENFFEVGLVGDRSSLLWEVKIDDRPYAVVAPEFEYYRRRLKLRINGLDHMFRLRYQESHMQVFSCGIVRTFEIYSPKEWSVAGYMLRGRKQVQENILRCPMPGIVVEVCVPEGTEVRKGQELLRMESMKMESRIASPRDGLIEKVLVNAGQTVDTNDALMHFREEREGGEFNEQ